MLTLRHMLTNVSFSQDTGDFASVAYSVLESRCPAKGTLTVEQVNNSLDEIAKSNATKDKKVRSKSFI